MAPSHANKNQQCLLHPPRFPPPFIYTQTDSVYGNEKEQPMCVWENVRGRLCFVWGKCLPFGRGKFFWRLGGNERICIMNFRTLLADTCGLKECVVCRVNSWKKKKGLNFSASLFLLFAWLDKLPLLAPLGMSYGGWLVLVVGFGISFGAHGRTCRQWGHCWDLCEKECCSLSLLCLFCFREVYGGKRRRMRHFNQHKISSFS